MKVKRIFACILASCTMLGSMSFQGISFVSSSAAGSDSGIMRDDMTAFKFAYEMGLGINLGNTMEAYWLNRNNVDSGAQTIGENKPQNYETCWGAVVTTQETIDGMKAAGFNTVRIPVYWGNMMKNDGTFTINAEYIARVKEIVDYCRNDGLYAVINIHHYDEFLIRRYTENKELDECAKTFKNLWTQIAEYFKDYSDYLVFEGYNEYLGGGPLKRDENGNIVTDQWGNVQTVNLSSKEAYEWTNTLNQAFVDAVRATGGNNATRMLIASGYWTNIDNTTNSRFIMPTDTAKGRMMVSVHYVDNAYYWMKQVGNENWKNYSISQCELLKNAFTSKGIPVFIGETTSIYAKDSESHFANNASIKTSSEALDYMLRLITSYNFVPVLWDTNDNFYSRTDYKIKSSTDENVIKTLAAELAEKPFAEPIIEPTDPSNQPSSQTPSEPASNPTKASATTIPRTTAAPITAVKVPTQAKLTSLSVKSKAEKKITVSWKKVAKAKGYQVQVATKKTFKNSKIVYDKFTAKKKLTIKNKKIKSGKTYYVRVRAYAIYNNANNTPIKVYSNWNKKLRKVTVK